MAVTLSITLSQAASPTTPKTFDIPRESPLKVPFYPSRPTEVIVGDFRSFVMKSPLTGVGPVGAVSVLNTDFGPR